MKKYLLVTLAVIFAAFNGFAQIANGSFLEDEITFTDLDGVEHNLDDYLNDGKTVILDLFAEWCGPCWNYHNTGTGHPNGGALKTLYNTYGPEGTDDLMVFAIETDPSTAEALMYGGAGTNGWDWVTNTPYPMADANIGNIFEQAYYPYIIMICPNRQIYEVGQNSASYIFGESETCPVANGDINPALLQYLGETATCSDFEVEVMLQNLGNTTLTAATIEVLDNGTSILSYEWTGSLDTYEYELVALGTATVSSSTDIEITVTSSDDDPTNLVQAIAMAEESTDIVTVNIQLDNWPEETTWEITNENGSVVADGGPYDDQENEEISEEVILNSLGCYTFTIFDAFGDGLNGSQWGNFSDGEYTVLSSDGTVLASGGGTDNFEEQNSPFDVTQSVLSNNEIETFKGDVNLFPNPTSSVMNMQLSLTETQRLTMEITDMVGKRVEGKDFGTLSSGDFLFSYDLSHLSQGVYLVNFTSGESRLVKRITISE